jgi:hypothetical protein
LKNRERRAMPGLDMRERERVVEVREREKRGD